MGGRVNGFRRCHLQNIIIISHGSVWGVVRSWEDGESSKEAEVAVLLQEFAVLLPAAILFDSAPQHHSGGEVVRPANPVKAQVKRRERGMEHPVASANRHPITTVTAQSQHSPSIVTAQSQHSHRRRMEHSIGLQSPIGIQ